MPITRNITVKELTAADVGREVTLQGVRSDPYTRTLSGRLVRVEESVSYKGNMPKVAYSLRIDVPQHGLLELETHGPFSAQHPVAVSEKWDFSRPSRPAHV